jgi:hypothetical protein
MRLPYSAQFAHAADKMAFARHKIAPLQMLHAVAYRFHNAAELVPDNQGESQARLRPWVPAIDVEVSAAEGGTLHTHQHRTGLKRWFRHLA